MIVYNYHPYTAEYIGSSEADPDPLEEGKWLIPALSTTKKPAVKQENEVSCFTGSEWIIRPDFRGIKCWLKTDGSEFIISEIGMSPSSIGAVEISPVGELVRWSDDSGNWVPDEKKIYDLAIKSADNRYIVEMEKINTLIVILQDAVDLAMATDAEKDRLNKLKTCRVLLSRVKEQVGYPMTIDWPDVSSLIQKMTA